MTKSVLLAAVALACAAVAARGAESPDAIRRMEIAGDALGARAALARAAMANPNDAAAQAAYAEFLERHGDPGSREAYHRLLVAARKAGDSRQAGTAARRLVLLDLLEGDSASAAEDRETYAAITGKRMADPAPPPAAHTWGTAAIPGPMRSFARMAAIPSDVAPDDVLPAFARNIVTQGYQAANSKEALEPTEYLKLVKRYLSQARELQTLAGDAGAIRVERCDSPNVADLLRVLGYRMRGGCGSDVVLETVNASRAFLTTDSGFPIHELEQALRTDRPFHYDYRPSAVPVLFGPAYWLTGMKEPKPPEFLDAFISDPAMARLYLGFSKLDPETAAGLRNAALYSRLKLYGHVLDFFGGMFEIRDGKAVTPGGPRSAAAWAEMAGVSPEQGPAFFEKLIAFDDGWLASLYDSLARIRGPAAAYLLEPARLKRFYAALRGRATSPGPARPVFRAGADLMLVTSRLQMGPDGKPHIPGGLDVWKKVFATRPSGKYDSKALKAAASWKDADDLLETVFAICRKPVENQPLRLFMAITDIDRNRPVPLQPATIDRLAREYRTMSAQYPVFTESRRLSDESIVMFFDTATAIRRIKDQLLESDASGTYQGLVGIWQILVRLRSIPEDRADAAFEAIAKPFGAIRNTRELFDAGRTGVNALLMAASGTKEAPPAGEIQERMIELLAGAADNGDAEAREESVREFQRIMEAQRIVGLGSLLQLADHVEAVAGGAKLNPALLSRLMSPITEIHLPRASLTTAEKTAVSFGFWSEKHVDAERSLNLRAAFEKAASDPEKIREIRGLLAPLLRDAVVALNYAYYAPPGAQILYANPLFVRSHDFVGVSGESQSWRATEVFGSGWPSNGGGRLVGSLSGLPYALAMAEQNFLVPSQTQALIWGDLAPQIILSAKASRWSNVTPIQMHWVALHLRYGREALAESAEDPQLRSRAVESIAALASPARARQIAALLASGDVKQAVDLTTPSELYLLARDLARQPGDGSGSCILSEIREIERTAPAQISESAISRAFGTPKPTLSTSYQPELLYLRTFPTLMGYSSRMLAESWESNTLYWAMLADDLHLAPGQLNVRIPEWTRKVLERIFAANLDDWPAVLRSLRAVGEEERANGRRAFAAGQNAAAQEISNR